jgi:hypothetical protein
MNLNSPSGAAFAALRYFIKRPVYRVMLPKMPKTSKYKRLHRCRSRSRMNFARHCPREAIERHRESG